MNEMTADEMRDALYQQLHDKGLLHSLKSQLRNYLVSEISGSRTKPSQADGSSHKSCLTTNIIHSLIYDYLSNKGYDYSVGVFLPEVQLSKKEVLDVYELNKLLKLLTHETVRSTNHQQSSQTVKETSFFESLINHLLDKVSSNMADSSSQTETESLGYLTDKLSSIDLEFSSRNKPVASSRSVEETLIICQKKAEDAANQKAQKDLEHWKKSEIERLQWREKDKQSKELQEKRKQLEEEYRKKMLMLSEREKALGDSLKIEFESVQRETFQQRQHLLHQSEKLRQQEADLRYQKEEVTRLQRLNEEKLEKLEAMLNKRDKDLHNRELQLENTLKLQQDRCRTEIGLAYETKNRELKAYEEKLKDKEACLEREKKALLTQNERNELVELRLKKSELDGRIGKYELDIAGLEMKVSGLQERLAKVYDYEIVKESNISAKKELELLKERLEISMREQSLLQEKYDQLMLDSKEKAGLNEILLVKTQMQRERDRALDDKLILEHRLKELEMRYEEQKTKNTVLIKQFELQTDRQRDMNREYGKLCRQFDQTSSGGIQMEPLRIQTKSSVRRFNTQLTNLDGTGLDDSLSAELSIATDESVVVETRKRLDELTKEADNLQSAFHSLTKYSPVKRGITTTSSALNSEIFRDLSLINTASVKTHGLPSRQTPLELKQETGNAMDHDLQSQLHTVSHAELDGIRANSKYPSIVTSTSAADQQSQPISHVRQFTYEKDVEWSQQHQGQQTQEQQIHVQQQQTPQQKVQQRDENLGHYDIEAVKASDKYLTKKPEISESLADKWKDHLHKVPVDKGEVGVISPKKSLSLDSHWQDSTITSGKVDERDTQKALENATKNNTNTGNYISKSSPSQGVEDDDGIDPVMKKYMRMIQSQEQTSERPTDHGRKSKEDDEENSLSVSGSVSLAGPNE